MTDRNKPESGWESDASSDGYRNFSDSGVGAVTHGPGGAGAGEGDYGGGRGTDYAAPPKGDGDASAREGEARPEFPPLGWGERGEDYPPAQGPNDREGAPGSEDQDRRFQRGEQGGR